MLKRRRAKSIKFSTAYMVKLSWSFIRRIIRQFHSLFLSHYRRTYRKPVETKTVVNLQGKSSSQRFHQRRRRI